MDALRGALEDGMNITGAFVLKQDIMLIPCAEVREDARQKIAFEEGD